MKVDFVSGVCSHDAWSEHEASLSHRHVDGLAESKGDKGKAEAE